MATFALLAKTLYKPLQPHLQAAVLFTSAVTEIGMGQHDEAGTGRMKLKSADESASIMLVMLLEDLAVVPGEELLVLLMEPG